MKEKFNQLNLIHLAMLIGQVVFCAVIFFVAPLEQIESSDESPLFSTAAPLVLIAAFGVVYYLNKQIRQYAPEPGGELNEKLDHYRKRVLLRMGAIEGANLVVLVATMTSNDLNLLVYFLVGLLAFLYYRPSEKEFVRSYGLSEEDKEVMGFRNR